MQLKHFENLANLERSIITDQFQKAALWCEAAPRTGADGRFYPCDGGAGMERLWGRSRVELW